jgi:copper transport protein
VRSDPPDGAELATAPERIVLWFDERLRLPFSSFELRTLAGDLVPLRSVEGAAAETGTVILRPPQLAHGIYVVSWAVMSEEDAHVSRGMIVFGVGEPVSAAQRPRQPPQPIRPLEVLLRWLDLMAIAGLVGGLTVAGAVLGRSGAHGDERTLRGRALSFAAACGTLAVAAGLGLLLVEAAVVRAAVREPRSLTSTVGELLGRGRFGDLWWVRQACLLALGGAAWWLSRVDRARRPVRRWAVAAVMALCIILAYVRAAGGHAAALREGWVPIVVAAAHLLAAATWIGGLSALAFALAPEAPRLRAGSAYGTALRPFGRFAALSFALLLVTGLFSLAREVATPDGLVLTTYGRALLAKAGLVAAAGGVGLVNAVLLGTVPWLARRLGRSAVWRSSWSRRLFASVVIEIALGVLALGAVGVMTSTQPARGPMFASAPPAVGSVSRRTGDLVVSVSITPNLPGSNVVVVRVASSRRPALAPIERVALDVGGDDPPIDLESVGEDAYRAGLRALDRAGPWPMTVVVERAGLPTERLSIDWVVGGGPPPPQPLLSDRPLRGPLTAVAGGLSLGMLLVGALRLIRRRQTVWRSAWRWGRVALSAPWKGAA